MSLSNLSAVAATFEDLLSYHDERFIRSAYVTLLDREPDPGGLRYYLAKVRGGVGKLEILSQLHSSEEGMSRQEKITSLKKAIETYKRQKAPYIGLLLRLTGAPKKHDFSAIEEKLYAIEPQIQQRFPDAELQFVHRAYHAIFCRTPDHDGLRFYLQSVRAGVAKVEILAQLMGSEEGNSRWSEIAKLNKNIRVHQRMKVPVLGIFLRLAGKNSSDRSGKEYLRAIENNLHLLDKAGGDAQRHLRTFESKLEALNVLNHTLQQSLSAIEHTLHAHYTMVQQQLNDMRLSICEIEQTTGSTFSAANTEMSCQPQPVKSDENPAHAVNMEPSTSGLKESVCERDIQFANLNPDASNLLRWYYDLMHCPLFDRQWYLARYPDVSYACNDPLWHYIEFGWKENRRPGLEFDGEYYRTRYPDTESLEQPPLLHYWMHGRFQSRYMNPSLDLEWLQDDARAASLIDRPGSDEGAPSVGDSAQTQGVTFISVIIPTYNRIKLLPGIVDSWRKVHACTSFPYEIIFSDDGSSDGSAEYLESVKELPLRVLRNAHGGASSARNAAIRAACGERLLIFGDDIFPDQEILNIHAGLAKQKGANVAILGVVNWHQDLAVNHLMHHITEIGNEQFSYNRFKDCSYLDFRHFYTCNICVDRRFLLEEKVIFDERFDTAAFEDVELGYRLSLRGLRLYYTTQARGAHYHPYTAAGFCRRQVSAGRMAVVFRNIHPGMEQVLGVDALSIKASKDQQSSGQDAIWKDRVETLLGRCDEYEHLVAKLPNDLSIGIRECLSAVYSRLFSAMYECGVLKQLGSHPNALGISMASRFDDTWANYWTTLAQNKGQTIDLDADEGCNLGMALNTGNAANLFFGYRQRAAFDELIQIKRLAHSQQPIGLKPTDATPTVVALPAIILEPGDPDRDDAIASFRAAFGNAALVYERSHSDLLIPQLQDSRQGEPVNSSVAEATVFFWPTSAGAIVLKDHLLNAYIALVENGLSMAVISHSLVLGQTVSVGALRDHSLFSRDVAESMFKNALGHIPLRGKILRLLPSNRAVQVQKLDELIGAPLDIDDDGFFTNRPISAIVPIRYEAPYLPPRSKLKPVVFVFPIFLAVGGVERNTIEIMRQLNDRFDFFVVTMERLRPEQGSLAAQAIEVAARVIEMSEIVRHSEYLQLMARLKANIQPDLIWVCNGSPWFCDNAVSIRQIFHNVPIIDQEVYDVEQGWIARYGEPGIRSFDRFIAVNKKIEERFRRDFLIDPARIDLIYSAVDTSRIRRFKQSLPNSATLRAKFALPDDKLIFTFIGRLAPQKRPLEFLKLAKKRLQHSSEYFVLVGDGELAPEVQAFIIQHQLNNVMRIPYIENTLELHAVSDGIMFTSAYEGLPIAMIEALAMGVPTFATDVGDIADVLAEYDGGAVVPVNSLRECVDEALVSWLGRRSDYAMNLKKFERDILERFSSENIAQQYVECWKSAMGPRERKVA